MQTCNGESSTVISVTSARCRSFQQPRHIRDKPHRLALQHATRTRQHPRQLQQAQNSEPPFPPALGGDVPRNCGVGRHVRVVPGFRLEAVRPGRARGCPSPSDSRWPSLDGPRWPLRFAEATTRGVPAPRLGVSCPRSRRCQMPAREHALPPGVKRLMAGFQLSINGRFWVSTEGKTQLQERCALGEADRAKILTV